MPNHIISNPKQSENLDMAEILSGSTIKIPYNTRYYSQNSKNPNAFTIGSELKTPKNQFLDEKILDECEDYISFRSGIASPQEGFANPPKISDFSIHSHNKKYRNFGTMDNMTLSTENMDNDSTTKFKMDTEPNNPTIHQYSFVSKNYQSQQKSSSQPPSQLSRSNKEYEDDKAQKMNLDIQNVLLNSANRSHKLSYNQAAIRSKY